MVLFQLFMLVIKSIKYLKILDLGVTRITYPISGLLIGLRERFHVPGALTAHTLTASATVMPPDGHVEGLLTDLAGFQLMKSDVVRVEALRQAIEVQHFL